MGILCGHALKVKLSSLLGSLVLLFFQFKNAGHPIGNGLRRGQ
jgi:hypothetical protein